MMRRNPPPPSKFTRISAPPPPPSTKTKKRSTVPTIKKKKIDSKSTASTILNPPPKPTPIAAQADTRQEITNMNVTIDAKITAFDLRITELECEHRAQLILEELNTQYFDNIKASHSILHEDIKNMRDKERLDASSECNVLRGVILALERKVESISIANRQLLQDMEKKLFVIEKNQIPDSNDNEVVIKALVERMDSLERDVKSKDDKIATLLKQIEGNNEDKMKEIEKRNAILIEDKLKSQSISLITDLEAQLLAATQTMDNQHLKTQSVASSALAKVKQTTDDNENFKDVLENKLNRVYIEFNKLTNDTTEAMEALADGLNHVRFDVRGLRGVIGEEKRRSEVDFDRYKGIPIFEQKKRSNMGKVHGSLARAGKVKGQTPKVEKVLDKKSDPRGRAKKRMQYNRRYVNVVTGAGGRTLGPNSNADKMK